MDKRVIAGVIFSLTFVATLSFAGRAVNSTQPEFRVTTSSVLNDQSRYRGENAVDNNSETAWVEGVAGPGIGEWIQIQFAHAWNVAHVGIIPGYIKQEYREDAPFEPSRDFFLANNRIRSATLYLNESIEKRIELYDFRIMQYFVLPNISLKAFKLQIDAVYPGSQWDDTCISEIRFLGKRTESEKTSPIAEEVPPEQPTVYTSTIQSDYLNIAKQKEHLASYLAELKRVRGALSEEAKETIEKSVLERHWASVGGNIHFLEWLETRGIVTQIEKKQDKWSNEILVYQMDLKKAHQHKKELLAQFKAVGDDAATNILYGLAKAAIAFKDKEIIRFFIYCPGPDGAGGTNRWDILQQIKDVIPITFLRVLFEQPKEVQRDTIQSLFDPPIETGQEWAKICIDRQFRKEDLALIKRYNALVDEVHRALVKDMAPG